MLQALLHGKLSRQQKNMEDVLTSNVFGLLRYLPPSQGLLPLLSQARTTDGEQPLRWLIDTDRQSPFITNEDIDYLFWERLHEPGCIFCESDLLLRVRVPSERNLLILIEAKYRSPKSSKADPSETRPKDQLAREWDNLVRRAKHEDATPFLIFTTASVGIPQREIQASVVDYLSKPGRSDTPQILWLSWRQISEVFGKNRDVAILSDLCELTERLGLKYFHGFSMTEFVPRESHWRFDAIPRRWFDLLTVPIIDWKFTK
ncbi:MAG: hypothetical protein HUJ26_04530 [Planctomycetaceae bacterium]|nr:hypothetical protein [Planctomycetaceae bacterium]